MVMQIRNSKGEGQRTNNTIAKRRGDKRKGQKEGTKGQHNSQKERDKRTNNTIAKRRGTKGQITQ